MKFRIREIPEPAEEIIVDMKNTAGEDGSVTLFLQTDAIKKKGLLGTVIGSFCGKIKRLVIYEKALNDLNIELFTRKDI